MNTAASMSALPIVPQANAEALASAVAEALADAIR